MEAQNGRLQAEIYAVLREKFANEVPELPENVDLVEFANRENALPLEAFIDEIQNPREA